MKAGKSPRRAAATPALRVLQAAGVPHAVRAYEHDPSGELPFGLEAAVALGVDPARVLKTLVAEVDGTLVVAIVPVAQRVDLKALAAAAGGRHATMAQPAVAERATGYVVGGISPFGQRKRLPTVLHESALRQATVLVSAGRRGLDVELAPCDLVLLTGAIPARLCRDA